MSQAEPKKKVLLPWEQIPVHPIYKVQDWDDAPGAIDWPRLRASLEYVKDHGVLPDSHSSHDHLNEQREVPVSQGTLERLKVQFQEVEGRWAAKGFKVTWALLDGFLLYWDKEIVEKLDVKIFIHVPEEVLRKRRYERHGYHTAVQSDGAEGSLWRDPPNYWEQIVYPAYVRAHKHLFKEEDVEKGDLTPEYTDQLLLLRGEGNRSQTVDMGRMLEASAERIFSVSNP
ncbi:ribosylnicotinamide kinase [Rhizoctonia solani]